MGAELHAPCSKKVELIDSVPWKWRAKYKTLTSKTRRWIVDLFHFLISITGAGMSAEDPPSPRKKNEVNHKRQTAATRKRRSRLQAYLVRIPAIQGIIKRRFLINFGLIPQGYVHLPSAFKPKMQAGYAIGGICSIRWSRLAEGVSSAFCFQQ